MRTIINQSLSDMLDKILQKALEEKPKKITECNLCYDYMEIYRNTSYTFEDIVIYNRDNKTFELLQVLQFRSFLTDNHIKMINKIFQKWSKENANNNKSVIK